MKPDLDAWITRLYELTQIPQIDLGPHARGMVLPENIVVVFNAFEYAMAMLVETKGRTLPMFNDAPAPPSYEMLLAEALACLGSNDVDQIVDHYCERFPVDDNPTEN